jgi:methionine synthase II (cobalamin-independent)
MRSHTLLAALLLGPVLGCQTPESAIQPLPPDARPLPYAEMHTRAKSQVAAAQEFFYRDSWRELEQAALALQQSAELMARIEPEQLPLRLRERAPDLLKQLRQAAEALDESARERDVARTTQIFQTLNLTIRELRPE